MTEQGKQMVFYYLKENPDSCRPTKKCCRYLLVPPQEHISSCTTKTIPHMKYDSSTTIRVVSNTIYCIGYIWIPNIQSTPFQLRSIALIQFLNFFSSLTLTSLKHEHEPSIPQKIHPTQKVIVQITKELRKFVQLIETSIKPKENTSKSPQRSTLEQSNPIMLSLKLVGGNWSTILTHSTKQKRQKLLLFSHNKQIQI